VSSADDRILRERFGALRGPQDGNWSDVRRRVRRRSGRLVAFAVGIIAALFATGFGLSGHVIGLFADHGKPVPLTSFPPRDRELLVSSLCHRLAFSAAHGRPPQEVCLDGRPTVEEIARNDSEIHWRIRYPWGVTCIATGKVGGYRDPNRGNFSIGSMGCNVGASHTKLVPTPKRPITVEMSIMASTAHPRARLLRVSGLAGEGVAKVGLVPGTGSAFTVPVRGSSYAFKAIPDRDWVAVAAFDAAGKEVFRSPVELAKERPPVAPSALPHGTERFTRPPKRPKTAPVQRGSSPTAAVDVWRSGVVELRFASTQGAYRALARSARHSSGGVDLTCGKVAFGGGRWRDLAGGATTRLAPEIRVLLSTRWGGFPSPPFDYCEVAGTYGRYWNDEEGTHELVEVPFTAAGRRFLDDRGVARDLAYFERTRKMWRIRKAVHRGEPAPSAAEIAALFGPRVVPMADRNGTAPTGKVGVWTDGRVIVASERAPDGRRLFVTIRGVLIGATNIRDLAFLSSPSGRARPARRPPGRSGRLQAGS